MDASSSSGDEANDPRMDDDDDDSRPSYSVADLMAQAFTAMGWLLPTSHERPLTPS